MSKGKTKSFALSDESINTYGFRCLTAGSDLKQFNRNPVMYYMHDEWSMPIGRWENIRVEDGVILADPVFDLEDPKAAEVAGKVERGFLRMASAGIRIIAKSDDPKVMLPGQTLPTVTKWQMREASIVGIGSNHNAIRLYDENGSIIPENGIMKLFDKSILNKQKKMNEVIYKLLDLPTDATDEQLQDKVQKLVDDKATMEAENKTLKDDASKRELADKELRKNEAVTLVDAAVKDGRLNADGREGFLQFFDNDFEVAKKALTAIPKRVSVKKEIETASKGDGGDLAKLSAMSWDELDKANKLVTLKDKYPDVFQEKFDAKFPK